MTQSTYRLSDDDFLPFLLFKEKQTIILTKSIIIATATIAPPAGPMIVTITIGPKVSLNVLSESEELVKL
jgi:hypothetical protein